MQIEEEYTAQKMSQTFINWWATLPKMYYEAKKKEQNVEQCV